MKTIGVKYLCSCLSAEVEVQVPERKPNQDIVDWMERVLGNAIGADHRRRSPRCTRTTMTHCKIPMGDVDGPQAPGIGFKPRTN